MLSYEASDSVNLYASASKGSIPGGFNLTAAQEDVAEEVVRFDQESVWSYEAGLKMRFPNGRGYLNLAWFYIESDNWQEVQVLLNGQGQVISSAFIAAAASIECNAAVFCATISLAKGRNSWLSSESEAFRVDWCSYSAPRAFSSLTILLLATAGARPRRRPLR